ncbi:MAG: hypothetical protein Q3983_06190 [Capnocytophaga sp.]|nr:hypothetical protein [Capnocytophaga sp.]
MNGTKHFIDTLFNGNEDAFIEHFVKSCLFIPQKEVEKRAKEMLTDISNNAKINVRFGKRYLNEFEAEPKRNALTKKDKVAIKKIASEETLYFKAGKVKVAIDGNGNQTVVTAIEKATGYTINGNNSDFFNYTLSHVWANTTHNPYYFSSLWNVVVIPNYLNYIMDKPETQDPINGKVQELIKAICIELYQPDTLMNAKIEVEKPSEKAFELAKKAIAENRIHFLNKKEEASKIKAVFEDKLFDEINKLSNKDFAFRCLDLMEEYGVLEDNLSTLTNAQECKETLGHYFPILLENNKENTANNKDLKDRYYAKPFFEYNGKQYYVTNDWYEKTEAKASNRDNRPIFIGWIYSLLNE